jgi:hypothetical protein
VPGFGDPKPFAETVHGGVPGDYGGGPPGPGQGRGGRAPANQLGFGAFGRQVPGVEIPVAGLSLRGDGTGLREPDTWLHRIEGAESDLLHAGPGSGAGSDSDAAEAAETAPGGVRGV